MHQFLENTCAIIGAQWGDEGKGKLVDILSQEFDVIARAAGGANAGHTIYANGKKFVFHLIPSGLLHEGTVGVIGNGCVVHLPTLMEELESLHNAGISTKGRLFISDRAHLIFDFHKEIDSIQEERKGKNKVGTTKRGIGPAYTDKASRMGIRAGELVYDFAKFEEHFRHNVAAHQQIYGITIDSEAELKKYQRFAQEMKEVIVDTAIYLRDAERAGKRILLEGAQGSHLDIDLGTYPFVTSSHTTTAGACSGTGIAPKKIDCVIGILKAYTTRVGGGPFPSEEEGAQGQRLRDIGGEYGATTGRPRRCGWLDIPVANHAALINGVDFWNVTKLDVLSGLENIQIVTSYTYNGQKLSGFPADLGILANVEKEYLQMPGWEEDISEIRDFADLPENAQKYIHKIEELTDVPVKFIGVGMDREAMITR